MARCSDSIGTVFGFEWRGVRIRLAQCLDSTWALDKQMLWVSGCGFRGSACTLRASGFGLRAPDFLLQASGCKPRASGSGPQVQALQASGFMLRAPGAGIGFACASALNMYANCVRTSLVKVYEFRTTFEIYMHPARASCQLLEGRPFWAWMTCLRLPGMRSPPRMRT